MDVDRILVGVFAAWVSATLHVFGGISILATAPQPEPATILPLSLQYMGTPSAEVDSPAMQMGETRPKRQASASSIPNEKREEPFGANLAGSIERHHSGWPHVPISGWRRLEMKEQAYTRREALKSKKISIMTKSFEKDALGEKLFGGSLCSPFTESAGTLRRLEHVAFLTPNGTFDPNYVSKIQEWSSRQKIDWGRLGKKRVIVLPPIQTHLLLDAPDGYLASVGVKGVSCRVEVELGERFFPIRLSRIPVDIVSGANRVSHHVVDAQVFADGSFEIVDGSNLGFPFQRGRLPYADSFASAVGSQLMVAIAVQGIGDWLRGE
jgi:hypothetical protein